MKFVILGLYVAVLLTVAFLCMKKTKTLNDFFLGGRSVGPWLSAISYGTTYFSAVMFIGYAGKSGWSFGLSDLWIVLGNAVVGSFLAWYLLAKRTRDMTVRLGAMTMPDFLSKRYNSKNMKIFAALVIFIFLVPYCSSVYMGLSYFFESIFNIPYEVALFAIAGVTAIYMIMGGYKAMTMIDFILGIIMIIAVGALIYFMVNNDIVGGWSQIIPGLKAVDPKLTSVMGPDPISLFSLVILTSLGPWGMPQMTQRFYAIKDNASVKRATIVTFFFALWIAFGAYFTGSLSHLFFPSLDAVGGNVDKLVPSMITMAIPAGVAVLILLLVLSASMSTLASLVLVSSSSIAVDLVAFVRPATDSKTTLWMMRVLCLVFIGISLYVALMPNFILTLMAFSWGAVAGTFLAPYVLGLFSKKITKTGAWAGMISGLGIAIVFSALYPSKTALVGSIAMLVPLIVCPVVSLFTKGFDQEHLDKVFNDKLVEGELE